MLNANAQQFASLSVSEIESTAVSGTGESTAECSSFASRPMTITLSRSKDISALCYDLYVVQTSMFLAMGHIARPARFACVCDFFSLPLIPLIMLLAMQAGLCGVVRVAFLGPCALRVVRRRRADVMVPESFRLCISIMRCVWAQQPFLIQLCNQAHNTTCKYHPFCDDTRSFIRPLLLCGEY